MNLGVRGSFIIAFFTVPAILVSFLWAAFFSVGFKGGSTADLIRYNFHDPVLALVAYGPLGLSLVLFLAAVISGIAALRRRARTS